MASPTEFAALYGDAASRAGAALGVDPSVILGQWGLETGWGRSVIPGTNNLGNVKDFAGGGVAATDNMTGSRDRYRAYPSPDAFAADYVSLVQRRYPGALGAGADPVKFAAGLQGYAEDPRYSDKIAQAARMVNQAPGPAMNAVGKVVGGMLPSANAQGRNMADLSPEMSELVNAFSQKDQGQAENAPAADPMDALVNQFKQTPAARMQAPRQAQTAQPERGGGVLDTFSRVAANANPIGMVVNGLTRPGYERDMLKGFGSGVADVGNTIINGGAKLADAIGLGVQDPKQSTLGRLRITPPLADRQASMDDYNRENASTAFGLGRVGGNIAVTMPVGGAIGSVVKSAAALPMLSRVAPTVSAIGTSIGSGGLSTGLAPASIAGQVGNLGVRALGGGINGYASAGLIDPSTANTGGVIGAAAGPVLLGVGKGAGMLASRVRSFMTPDEVKSAEAILQAGGYKSPEEIAAVRAALAQQGPHITGEAPTVPQILQNPGVSQLQRTLRNSGETPILQREVAQDAARFATLDRVSPVAGTVQQSAENFGNALSGSVMPAEAQASRRVNAAFDAVDPMNETRFNLPIDQMQAAKDKFLGAGTFGSGSKADAALAEARRIGQETVPGIEAVTGSGKETDLLAAVKRASGIRADSVSGRAFAGELKDLRQGPGMGRLLNNKGGQSLDKLAEQMHASGYIEDADPATLLNALRSGDRVMPTSADAGSLFRAGLESSMGDAPGAMTMPKTVAFREMQNMRSSLGEAAQQASDKGANKEAAALRQMIAALDERTQAVASGKGAQGEHFPTDIVEAWQNAVKLHADKMDKFYTGPQASMFRNAGDGLPQAQGAELAPKFFNPRGSQSSDIASFNKIADAETAAALKNYATTDAADQTDRLGVLSNAKFQKWIKARSGAMEGLLTDAERAQFRGVAADLARADAARSLGTAQGSNTAQNVQNAMSLGLLDNKGVNILANRIPFVGKFTGPILDGLRETAKRGKVEKLGGLLADPEALNSALLQQLVLSRGEPIGLLSPASLGLLRSAPAAIAGSGRQ
ncbi:conserved hypothetical protein [Burkholderiales bacterium 8X]|nr:conserved hypothetical protein [Burkholderiales bacterium 8X]